MTHEIKTALIAGCGYLGFPVAMKWHNSGILTTAITRRDDRSAAFQDLGLRSLLLNLSQPEKTSIIPQADAVLWAVGYDRNAGVPREQIWLDGLSWLIRRLPSAPRRFIYISSTSVYGEVVGETADETTPPAPVTEGGKCCVRAEQLARAECAQRFPETQVVVLRMAGIYGPSRLLRRVSDLQNGTPLPGDPDHWLNLIHVDDAVRMVHHAAVADNIPDAINVVNSSTVTRREYYSRLAELVDAPAPVFDSSTDATGRRRSGNKRVISTFDPTSLADFQHDDVLRGLENAASRSNLSG